MPHTGREQLTARIEHPVVVQRHHERLADVVDRSHRAAAEPRDVVHVDDVARRLREPPQHDVAQAVVDHQIHEPRVVTVGIAHAAHLDLATTCERNALVLHRERVAATRVETQDRDAVTAGDQRARQVLGVAQDAAAIGRPTRAQKPHVQSIGSDLHGGDPTAPRRRVRPSSPQDPRASSGTDLGHLDEATAGPRTPRPKGKESLPPQVRLSFFTFRVRLRPEAVRGSRRGSPSRVVAP
ncbi:hypothetical protein Pla163_14620 [Planctomycetes bacterium Pla163]|uniref:Uncharacterized protein n=1 Tax=Rohdeia mirabilis TaxID=2528008 RepID=A0A518CYU5_9BACT|nr:hypothetical protein Pla163_14620 [Planctomycetes bacterium Pla163]